MTYSEYDTRKELSLVSEDKIKTLEWKVNNMPRKMFGYKTAYQMYQKIFKTKNSQLIFQSWEFNVT